MLFCIFDDILNALLSRDRQTIYTLEKYILWNTQIILVKILIIVYIQKISNSKTPSMQLNLDGCFFSF